MNTNRRKGKPKTLKTKDTEEIFFDIFFSTLAKKYWKRCLKNR